jgi:hypothetical protein
MHFLKKLVFCFKQLKFMFANSLSFWRHSSAKRIVQQSSLIINYSKAFPLNKDALTNDLQHSDRRT